MKNNQLVQFRDLGLQDYQAAWDYQEQLLRDNVQVKSVAASMLPEHKEAASGTRHWLLFTEHPPVYTLGKNGNEKNLLIDEDQRQEKGVQYFRINRGGDITFHGPGQLVGYPILDLEKFSTDIGLYLRNIEETIIRSLSAFGIAAGRSPGETGVWIDPGETGKERKICAIGVRTSRWITMHGFALNMNTDLSFFEHIIPCGIQHKKVTSMEKELGKRVNETEVKAEVRKNFEMVFHATLLSEFPL